MVSIIIRTYNEEKYLRKLLEALMVQNFNDFEIISFQYGTTRATVSFKDSVEGMNFSSKSSYR